MAEMQVRTEKLDEIGQVLRAKLDRQIAMRKIIEERWLTDIRQYHGRYAADFEKLLKEQEEATGSSAIFVNITRVKCDTAEARVADMLFPTDDRNWEIAPTPDPELSERTGDVTPFQLPDGQITTEGELADTEIDMARTAAKGMQREIDDQLTEARYAAIARDVIADAVKMGVGVIKGPVIVEQVNRSWRPVMGGVHELSVERKLLPSVRRVSPWDFYPDMSAATVADAEFFFERRNLQRKQLRQLARGGQGHIEKQIKRVLEDDAHKSKQSDSDTFRQRLREIADVYAVECDDSGYEMWVYTGPFDKHIAEAAGMPPPDVLDDSEIEVHFIGSTVVKIAKLPLETDEHGYSVFCWTKADDSIFGYGLPYILRACQEVVAKSWRAQLDNAAYSVGPQTVVDQRLVEPADGVWQLTPRKVWWKKDPSQPVGNAFASFNIDSHQPELKDIFTTARELADEVTGLPKLMQGEMGQIPAQTATGMSMLINASNTFLRRVIKHWDDDVTVPLITRFYDYNMQYSEDPAIKGDFQVDARGASTLLVKETQTQALLALLQFAMNPVFTPLFKLPALLRKAIEAQRISPDDIVFTDEELQQRAQQQAQGQQPDIEVQKLMLEQQKMQQQFEMKMLELSVNQQISVQELQAKLHEIAVREQSESERQDREIALKVAMGSGI